MRVEFGPLSIRLPRTKPAPSGQGFQHERPHRTLTDENQKPEFWWACMEVATMALSRLFETFIENSPICVMGRVILERTFNLGRIDDLFERIA